MSDSTPPYGPGEPAIAGAAAGRLSTHELSCGATVVCERIPGVRTAAMSWLLPVGFATDRAETVGTSTILSELILRGAGERSSRELSEAFEMLGANRSSDLSGYHLHLRLPLLGERVLDALPLMVDMIRRPTLPESALEPTRNLAVQTLDGLSDDPQSLAMVRLTERHAMPPFDRSAFGTRAGLEAVTLEGLRAHWEQRARPVGSILAFAGDIEPAAIVDRLETLLAGWTGEAELPEPTGPAAGGMHHLAQDSSQSHIAMAWEAPPRNHPDHALERLAIGVLGGGSSGRLFTEIRQRHSLCYSVWASYDAGLRTGRVTMYVGTMPERATEAFDRCRAEVERLAGGVTPEEFARARLRLRSRLVMQGESTQARASAIAADAFRIGRPRTLEEVSATYESVTHEQLDAYVAAREIGSMTTLVLGPDPVEG